ncbi:MAG: OmpH family outer membrane protein [Amphritea sp.]
MGYVRSIFVLVVMIVSMPVMAEKVASLGVQQALLSSKSAEAFRAQLKAEFGSEQKKLVELEAEVKKMQEGLQKAQGTQSKEVANQQRIQFQKAFGEYQRLGQLLQQKQREREQAFIVEMRPKLDKIIRDLIEREGYDIVVNKQATIFVKPELDITQKVVDLLNKQ